MFSLIFIVVLFAVLAVINFKIARSSEDYNTRATFMVAAGMSLAVTLLAATILLWPDLFV